MRNFLTKSVTTEWNTWDVNHINAVLDRKLGQGVRFGLYDTGCDEYRTRFLWRDGVHRLGHHSGDGRYACIELGWEDAIVTCEYAADGNQLVCRITPNEKAQHLALVIEPLGVWGAKVPSINLVATTPQMNDLSSSSVADGVAGVFPLTQVIDLAITLDTVPPLAKALAVQLDQQRDTVQAVALKSSGWLGNSAEGLSRAIIWNTIWEPTKGRVCSPVSRDWCLNPDGFGDYVLFEWDTFFCAMMAQMIDPDLAIANVRAMLQEVTPHGFVPNFGAKNRSSLDRSQPPVGAYCVLKLYHASALNEQHKNRLLLEEAFPALLRWHEWWFPNRDGNGDGLLEWGSDPVSSSQMDWEHHTLKAAMYESGLDNSPMWDDAIFNEDAHTMQLAAVGLNALYALDAWALSEIAAILDQFDVAQHLQDEYQAIADRINSLLWNEETGIYQNKNWDGQFSPVLSSTLFFPLLAGIVPPERAKQLVHDHLLNPNEFWGEHVIPTIARNMPSFQDQEYWRGRIWPPHNFLVCEGLRRAGFYEDAAEFARRSVNTFLVEWNEHGHVHENLNANTGRGEGQVQAYSDPIYTWGALMAYIAHQELIDAEARGWRFGSLLPDMAALHNIRVQEGMLHVRSGPDGLHVELNGGMLLATDCPTIVTSFRWDDDMTFYVNAADVPIQVRVGHLPSLKAVLVTIAEEQPHLMTTDPQGNLDITVTTGNCWVRIGIHDGGEKSYDQQSEPR